MLLTLKMHKTLVLLVRGTTLTKTLSFMHFKSLRASLCSESHMEQILYTACAVFSFHYVSDCILLYTLVTKLHVNQN